MKNDEFTSGYEKIVLAYNRKLFLYAKTLCGNNEHAEEIVQETLLTGFQYFGSLNDKQKVFPWLKTIMKRIYLRKFHKDIEYNFSVSIDSPAFDDNDLSIAEMITDNTVNIEDNFVRGELCRNILNEISKLSQKQRDSIIFRYYYGYSVKEIAVSLKMTDNSVRVSAHIGLGKVKENLKDYFIKGDYIMNCKETHAYLHQYAKGKISPHEKEAVENHINVCKDCRDMALSLIELEKHITFVLAREYGGKDRAYYVQFQMPEYSLEYVSINKIVESYQEINAKLEEWGEEIPLDEINLKYKGFLGGGFKFILTDYLTQEVLALFGDNGFRWTLEEHERNDNVIQYRLTKINKLCNPHEFSIVFIKKEKTLKPSVEHPDLIYGYAQHSPVPTRGGKIGIYIAVPSSGKNLLIKQGENVIDCGAYKFVYSDRHVLENEFVTVSCSYIHK